MTSIRELRGQTDVAEKLTYAERLDLERDRDGKPPLTPEERHAKLIRIRDGSLIWAERAVATASAKGGGAAIDYFVFACDQITKIENDASTHTNTRNPWGYTQFPMDSTGEGADETVN